MKKRKRSYPLFISASPNNLYLLDRTVPFKFGYSLYKAAPNPKQFYDFPLAGHGDIYDYGASKKVIQFLEEHSTKTSNH